MVTTLGWGCLFLIIGFGIGRLKLHSNNTKIETDTKKSRWKEYGLAATTGAITCILFIAYFGYFAWHLNLPPGGPDSWGDFGDFIGGLMNPVVGIFTIILLVNTLKSQQQAIDIQKNDLKEQRDEAARSTKALDAQFRAVQTQSFEQTLFKWFDSYKQSLNEIRTIKKDETGKEYILTGLAAVEYLYATTVTIPIALKDHFGPTILDLNKWRSLSQKTIEETHQHVTTRVDRIHRLRKNANLTRSIRLIYGLLRWIDSAKEINEKQKKLYANIIRAHLSEDELTILFYYGLTTAGKKLVYHMNNLAILDNFLGTKLSIIATLLSTKSPYTQSAFGESEPFPLKAHNYRNEISKTPQPI